MQGTAWQVPEAEQAAATANCAICLEDLPASAFHVIGGCALCMSSCKAVCLRSRLYTRMALGCFIGQHPQNVVDVLDTPRLLHGWHSRAARLAAGSAAL
jgi:hypothetical protein